MNFYKVLRLSRAAFSDKKYVVPLCYSFPNVSFGCQFDCIRQFTSCDEEESWESFLYISGKCNTKYHFVKPFLSIDNMEEIKKSIFLRNLNIDVEAMISEFTKLKQYKIQEDLLKAEINNLEKLQNDSSTDERSKLLLETNNKLNDLKELREKLWNCEKSVIPLLLNCPNSIHPDVKTVNEVLEQSEIMQHKIPIKSHMEIGKNYNTLKFSSVSPSSCYFVGKTAILELAIVRYFSDQLTQFGFRLIGCPDIFKSVIVEGCGKDPHEDGNICLLINENSGGNFFHLTGSSSKEALATYLTRRIISADFLPRVNYTIGRHFNGSNKNGTSGLFSLVQSTQIKLFIATEKAAIESHLVTLTDVLNKCYKEISIPSRTLRIACSNLDNAESLRLQYELWSPYFNKYFPCAHISLYNDYISKRLQMKYGSGVSNNFLYTIFGTGVEVPTLIGCIMENLQNVEGNFDIPDVLKPYMKI